MDKDARRIALVTAAAILVAGVAAYVLRDVGGVGGGPSQEEMADAVGADIMGNIYTGHVPGRSGEMYLVPKPHRFVLAGWDLRTLGTDQTTPGSTHPNPWDYIARVPIVLYGEGYAEPGKVVTEHVDIASIAPTYAELLGVEGVEAEAPPLDLLPGARPPKVIFTIVLDGGGWNALKSNPSSWPHMRRIMAEGTTYVNADIGSAPSITGALHATFGTGTYPRTHGLPGNQMRDPEGRNVDAWLENADGRYLRVPTVAELWDEQNDNEAVVATMSFEGWHLGMIGRGAQREGGDKDIAVLWDYETDEWWINEEFYEMPSYLQPTDVDKLTRYEEQLDPRDGLPDGKWFGLSAEAIRTAGEERDIPNHATRPATPAFVKFTGDAVIDIMRNEPWGQDDITDMFWVEMKMPDYAGHRWNMLAPEQADVLFETDAQVWRFKKELDRTIGRGNYLLALSADHGQQPNPDLRGGWRIDNEEIQRDLEARFGDGLIEKVTTVDIYFNRERIDEGLLDEIARFFGTYTIEDNIAAFKPGADRVPEARLDERLFAGAFSTYFLEDLTPERIESFGPSAYSQGVLDARGLSP